MVVVGVCLLVGRERAADVVVHEQTRTSVHS